MEDAKPVFNEIPRVVITRDFLLEGTFLDDARARLGDAVMSDDEIEQPLLAVLAQKPGPGPVWVFAYGSLMWNPAFEFAEQRVAFVSGWQRSFCVRTYYGRGSEENPALTLALDSGGSVEGVAFKVPAGQEMTELLLVWRREMFGRIYAPKWVDATVGARRIRAITFVAHKGGAYAGSLSEDQVVESIMTGNGPLGTAKEYFDDMMRHLDGLSITDRRMNSLRHLVKAEVAKQRRRERRKPD